MKEIAAGLGISITAVKARIFQARPKMRHELDQYFIKRAERRKRLHAAGSCALLSTEELKVRGGAQAWARGLDAAEV